MSSATRIEHDLLGNKDVPADAYYGVQTARALENFHISGVELRDHPGDLCPHGRRAEVLQDTDALVALNDIVIPQVLIHLDGVPEAFRRMDGAKGRPFGGKLRIHIMQGHETCAEAARAA